jgi:adenosylcobinamide kinase/adenosylcobinamide-phosphate guanylyltransferase
LSDESVVAKAEALAKLVAERPYSIVLVTNEVGQGVHPETASGLRFRDLLGVVNQTVAQAADEVVLMVAGQPLAIKDEKPRDRSWDAP